MDVIGALHMNGGVGEFSYANNSLIQRKVISMTRAIIEEAIINLYQENSPSSITIADLGCSSGPNTLLVVSEIIKIVEKIGKKNKVEYQIYLNDLHGNDFNSIFKSIPSFIDGLNVEIGACQLGPCLFAGVPGSFYGRLFPINTLYFIHSSSSLHWLSQVPEGLEENKENVYLANTSPKSVVEAYYKQFQKDFSLFLKCRAQELMDGGRMVLTLLGRRCQDPTSIECCYIWELIAKALNNMVLEGKVEKKKLDTFNLPLYMASATEIENEVVKEGSFNINRIEISVIDLKALNNELNSSNIVSRDIIDIGGGDMANSLRALVEPMLVTHFGEDIIDQLFFKCKQNIINILLMENVKTDYVNITVSLNKVG